MKNSLILFLFFSLFPISRAQEAPTSAKQPTTVTSDTFKLDMKEKEGLFTGNVHLTGTDFLMTSRELQVFFDADNQVKKLIARGSVKIDQPERQTTSNQAEYNTETNIIVLTGSPQVINNGNVITGNTITIDRTNNRLQTDKKTRVLIQRGVDS